MSVFIFLKGTSKKFVVRILIEEKQSTTKPLKKQKTTTLTKSQEPLQAK
jgi:hypothetical protein